MAYHTAPPGEKGEASSALLGLMTEETEGVFSFDLISDEFCDKLLEEMASFEQSRFPKTRPNSMNKYGIRLFY